jgi:hypothetical protein
MAGMTVEAVHRSRGNNGKSGNINRETDINIPGAIVEVLPL